MAGKITDEVFAERISRYKKMKPQNKRRSRLGVRVNCWETKPDSFFAEDSSRYIRSGSFDVRSFVGDEVLRRSDRWEMLRRARSFLSRRLLDDALRWLLLEKKNVPVDKDATVLDYFPALRYSYSAPLPARVVATMRGMSCSAGSSVSYLDLSCKGDGSSRRARVSDLSRSGSIRLDPVDAPRRLFLYRCRIQRCISWAYENGLVPLMMTVTVFHRWHPLRGLLNVLGKAWNYFFTASTAAVKRSKRMGLVGYIRRAEETINNTSGEYNSGWHPHYHVILFVPADKVSVVASMESELQDAWFHAVNRFFEKEFGEPIDESYADSFRRHGLFFSKTKKGNRHGVSVSSKDDDDSSVGLRHVDDSEYMAKIFGCDSLRLYCGDSELTAVHAKSSRVPFDLLLEDTAENVDLWVEYALATKGVCSFIFSRGLESQVASYFGENPAHDPSKDYVKSNKVVAQLSTEAYKMVAAHFKVDEMLSVAVDGYRALYDWFKMFYVSCGVSPCDVDMFPLPLPPNSRTPFGDVIESSDDGDVVEVCDDAVDDSADNEEVLLEQLKVELQSRMVFEGDGTHATAQRYFSVPSGDDSPVSRAVDKVMEMVVGSLNEYGSGKSDISLDTLCFLAKSFYDDEAGGTIVNPP